MPSTEIERRVLLTMTLTDLSQPGTIGRTIGATPADVAEALARLIERGDVAKQHGQADYTVTLQGYTRARGLIRDGG